MAEDGRGRATIRGAKFDETAILASGETEFSRDQGTSFHAEVPDRVYPADIPRADGTIIIQDCAINSLVIGSDDTKIDNRGGKTSIKITDVGDQNAVQQPESDLPPLPQEHQQGASGTNVFINTITDSSDTGINIEGARFNIKTKKRRNRRPPEIVEGQVNIANTGSVNLIAYSQGSRIDTRNSEINIE